MIAPEVTLIGAAATVVAWDAGAKAQVYIQNADIAFHTNRLAVLRRVEGSPG